MRWTTRYFSKLVKILLFQTLFMFFFNISSKFNQKWDRKCSLYWCDPKIGPEQSSPTVFPATHQFSASNSSYSRRNDFLYKPRRFSVVWVIYIVWGNGQFVILILLVLVLHMMSLSDLHSLANSVRLCLTHSISTRAPYNENLNYLHYESTPSRLPPSSLALPALHLYVPTSVLFTSKTL